MKRCGSSLEIQDLTSKSAAIPNSHSPAGRSHSIQREPRKDACETWDSESKKGRLQSLVDSRLHYKPFVGMRIIYLVPVNPFNTVPFGVSGPPVWWHPLGLLQARPSHGSPSGTHFGQRYWLVGWLVGGWVGGLVGGWVGVKGIGWLVGWLVGGWVGGLVGGWVGGLVGGWVGWLVGWLVGWAMSPPFLATFSAVKNAKKNLQNIPKRFGCLEPCTSQKVNGFLPTKRGCSLSLYKSSCIRNFSSHQLSSANGIFFSVFFRNLSEHHIFQAPRHSRMSFS